MIKPAAIHQTGTSLPNRGSLSILYIGPDQLTSGHRARALERLGHRVTILDPRRALPNNHWVHFWTHHTGAAFLEQTLRRKILARIPKQQFDVVFVGSAELIGPTLVRDFKDRFGRVISYNVDDPFGTRDGRRWNLFLKSVPFYDLNVVVRECNVAEALAHGAKDVLFVPRSADEVAHHPNPLNRQDHDKWDCDVAFIGTWMPERGPFLAKLAELGVPLSIRGNRWDRAKEWPLLKQYWRGPGVDNDEEYPKAIQAAKVCLGLLSKGNRDLSTQRSFEIPFLGGVFCAERTSEHLSLYRDNDEAVFWSTPEECARKCLALLADDEWRLRLRKNGRARCIQNGTTNERILERILDRVAAVTPV